MANRIEVIEYLKTYVIDEVGETRPCIDADNIDLIADGIVKLFSIHPVSYCSCENRSDNWYDDNGNNCFDCDKRIKEF